MSNRISVRLRASDILRRSFLPTTSRPERLLRPFLIAFARGKSSKIRTRFSGPQPDLPTETVTDASLKELEKDRELFDIPIEVTRDSSLPESSLISLEQTQPFPDQDLSSTRPEYLKTPDAPQPDEYGGTIPIGVRASYLYNLGKAYVSFYKSGLKNIWLNYKECREIKNRLGSYHINDVVKYGGKDGLPTISRREYQMYLRTRHDIRKLVPFSLILLVCGEFTPLVVLALGSAVVPSTCRIPKQVTSDQMKLLKRVAKAQDAGFNAGVHVGKENSALHLANTEAHIGYVWGLMPSPRPLPLLHSLLRARVVRRAEELVCDAILVRREGGIAQLKPSEALDFAKQASETLFLVIVGKEGRRPGALQLNPSKLKELAVPYFEEHTNKTLEILRNVEHDPRKHYLAGLRY